MFFYFYSMRRKGNYEKLQRRRSTFTYVQGHLGLSVPRISKRMKLHRSTIYRWSKLAEEGRLSVRKIPGRPCRLSADQKYELSRYFEYELFKSTPGWSITDAAELIKQKLNVTYNTDHVWRLLRAMGWEYTYPYYSKEDRKKGVKKYPSRRGRWMKKEH